MTRDQVRKVRLGHKVGLRSKTYYSIEYGNDIPDEEKHLHCVLEENWRRWRLLHAWTLNGVIDEMEDKELLIHEMKSYEIGLKVDDLESREYVRIVDGKWEDMFLIDNFGRILLNGEKREVIYIDDYHFELRKIKHNNGEIYHIHEFGEMVERHSAAVVPEPAYLAGLVDDFAQSFDPYDYADIVDDSDEHIAVVKADILSGDVGDYIKEYELIIRERSGTADERKEAKRLIPMLKAFLKEKEVAI